MQVHEIYCRDILTTACVVLLSDLVCDSGKIRLASGTSIMNGRVELCNNNAWETVCDTTWTDFNAGVVCRQIGLSGKRLALMRNFIQITWKNGQVASLSQMPTMDRALAPYCWIAWCVLAARVRCWAAPTPVSVWLAAHMLMTPAFNAQVRWFDGS